MDGRLLTLLSAYKERVLPCSLDTSGRIEGNTLLLRIHEKKFFVKVSITREIPNLFRGGNIKFPTLGWCRRSQ